MSVQYFAAEQDDSDGLTIASPARVPQLEAAQRGQIQIGLADGSTHVILGSGRLSRGIGYRLKDGLVEVRVNGRGTVLRTYGTWMWLEGSEYIGAPTTVV